MRTYGLLLPRYRIPATDAALKMPVTIIAATRIRLIETEEQSARLHEMSCKATSAALQAKVT